MEEDWDPLARRVPSFGRGLRILLVDHDTTSLMYISSILESHSFKVTTMELASLAMAIFEQRKDEFDLVMADINMQDMTTLSFIEQVLLMKDHMPIVLMSARYADKVVAEQALINGACFFLQKPISDNDLRNLWQHVYRKRWWSKNVRDSDTGSVDSLSESQESGDERTTESEQVSNEGNIDKRKCKRKIDYEQIHPLGKSPIEEEEEEEDGNEKREKGSNLEKRQYMKWTPDLHFKFTEAIRKLGDKKASPKAILELMNVPDLKQGHISSHLQKYKAQLRSMSEVRGDTSLPIPSSANMSTSNDNRQTGVIQFQEQQNFVGVNHDSSFQFHPHPLSQEASPAPGYAGPSNSNEYKLHPYTTKTNNGVQIVGYGKHQGSFPSDVNRNENGKGKQPLGFKGNSYQHSWQNLTQFSTPFKRLNEPQIPAAGLNSSGRRLNSDIPAGVRGTGDDGVPRLAHLANPENQSIAYGPGAGQDGLDESSVDLLTDWLSRSLDEYNPDN